MCFTSVLLIAQNSLDIYNFSKNLMFQKNALSGKFNSCLFRSVLKLCSFDFQTNFRLENSS